LSKNLISDTVGTVAVRGREKQCVRNKNGISVSEFPDFKQQRYDGGTETCFTCQRKLARVTILFFEGAEVTVNFAHTHYNIIYDNTIIIYYYSYTIYLWSTRSRHTGAVMLCEFVFVCAWGEGINFESDKASLATVLFPPASHHHAQPIYGGFMSLPRPSIVLYEHPARGLTWSSVLQWWRWFSLTYIYIYS